MKPRSPSGRIILALIVAGLGVLLMTGLFTAGSRPPRLALRAVAREPVEVMDEAAKPLELVTLVVDSLESQPLRFVQLAFVVEARVAGNWADAELVSNWGGTVWDRQWDALILVPADADACRMRFQYATHPVWVRCLYWLTPRGGWLDAHYPAVSARIWTWARVRNPQPRWREVPLETRLGPAAIPSHSPPALTNDPPASRSGSASVSTQRATISSNAGSTQASP